MNPSKFGAWRKRSDDEDSEEDEKPETSKQPHRISRTSFVSVPSTSKYSFGAPEKFSNSNGRGPRSTSSSFQSNPFYLGSKKSESLKKESQGIKRRMESPISKKVKSPIKKPKITEEIVLSSDSGEEETAEETSYEEEPIINIVDSDEEESRRFDINVFEKEKCELMIENAKVVEYDQFDEYARIHDEVKNQIDNDPILKKYYKLEIDEENDFKAGQYQAARLVHSIEEAKKDKKTPISPVKQTEELPDQIWNALLSFSIGFRYNAPNKRIRIMKNLTRNPRNVIPVFTELPNETLKSIKIPETSDFEYINENVVGRILNGDLSKSMKKVCIEAEKTENIITCDCHNDSNDLVCCYNNPNCACFKVNMKLKKLQGLDDYREKPTEFNAFGKVMLRDIDHYFDTFSFSCGEKCRCRGNCDNNIMLIVEKNVHRFELYRYDLKGFGIRAQSFIPYGTPVFEFTGEIIDYPTVLHRNSADYAFHMGSIVEGSKVQKIILESVDNNNKEHYRSMKHLLGSEWYIDPKRKGNESRFVTHGCQPNLAMIRVFRYGLAPHQTKCLMISLENIFPGTQLTFDYGSGYVKDHLQNNCLCSTVGCSQAEQAALIAKASNEQIFQFFTTRFRRQKRDFLNFVVNKLPGPESAEEKRLKKQTNVFE